MPNIVNDPIVIWEKIIFLPLQTKLGLLKQFVRGIE